MRPLLKFALVLSLAAAGCTGSQRADTIKAALVTVDAARDGFLTYDAAAQARIVAAATSADDARARLADYRTQRDAPTGPAGLLDTAFHAIAFAAAGNDAKSLADMKAAIAQLAAAIKPYLSTGASK